MDIVHPSTLLHVFRPAYTPAFDCHAGMQRRSSGKSRLAIQ